ncbi:TetR/AcrR family transcriptional regulator [Clostridium sp. CM028]|uniref:TetR/AcrR family transcriptional regulator n=1 Tax=unclassified Clostridium TaxID=2614128 RepID=UPI001C6F46EE|nr:MULTISPECIES: TetR/AcrR family transcriptional regulator [unclassified Clostridium]MBW9147183.1 TetR/AcrR family transcriptional regulator [Clostridium sp. CM027]MBW9150212.1 TetR/AcrR family transcriptional regulator [Clostridium sp. CM028]UVE39645.1 TetR/AcrR family transcriptional regulator [Clostridium sp. CM027]WLC60347.1 TetR/AcrR family transcriptional regulator [Clostridium sp. CM028]
MNKYEIRTNKKKLSIVNAANGLFKEKGFVNVNIKEIASQANVSQVSIYNYFGNKDALVAECVNSLMGDVLEAARKLLYTDMNFKEKILKALSLCSNYISKSLSEYFTLEALNDKVLIKLITESVNKNKFELFRDYIEVGKDDGTIDKTIPTDTIMRFIEIISIAESNVNYSKVSDKYIQDMQTLMFYGIIGN